MKAPQAPAKIDPPTGHTPASGPKAVSSAHRPSLALEVIPIESHYPQFDVMDEATRWDEYTRGVVAGRMDDPGDLRTLNSQEAKTLKSVAMHLLYEDREEVLTFVIANVDQRLSESIGESQRKVGLPPIAELIRTGLQALDLLASARHAHTFVECDVDQQFALLSVMQLGQLEPVALSDGASNSMQIWVNPLETAKVQKGFFNKLLGLLVEALASYPTIWSEMGYAGPAYPRGYYRIARGLTDPWEAHAPAQKLER